MLCYYTYSINNALGGSETAITCLSKSFPEKYEIYVAGDITEEKVDNITYVHFDNLHNLIKNNAFHTVIVSRYLNFYELYKNFSAYQTFIWGHDITLYAYGTDLSVESILTKWSSKITGCVCQTEWHKDLFLSSFPQLKDKFNIINNGINIHLFNTENKKQTNKFVYTSCSERGLSKLIQLWPNILENLPDAELFISSYNDFPKTDEDNRIQEFIKQNPSVKHLGKLNRKELYEMMSSAEYWLYPSYFQETSCITSLELLASEVICLYYPIAGLVNTVGDYGIQISEGNEVDKLLNLSIKQKTELKKKGKQYALSSSWKNRAEQWCNMFFSNDLPLVELTAEKNNIKVVNLKRREDRKKIIIEKFERENITNYEFIDAVDGNDLKETDELRLLFDGNNFNYRKGIMGCALSHLHLWNTLANDNNNDYYIILEDDLELSLDFKEKLNTHCKLFEENNLEHLSLGVYECNYSEQDKIKTDEITIFQKNVYNFWNITFGYIISKNAAKKMVSYINNCSIKCAIDNPLSHGEVLKYHHTTCCIVKQRNVQEVGTDIQYDFNNLQFTNTNNNNNKNLKIAYCDWWYEEYCGGSFDPNNNFITYILQKYGNISDLTVVQPHEKPNILFYTIFGNEHLKYPNTRKIFFSGEPFGIRAEADFNFTFDRNSDKNTRFPLWLGYLNNYLFYECHLRKNGFINIPKRENFCSFISNGEVKTTHRKTFVEKLSKYKKVHCGGKFLNNIGYTVPRGVNCSGKIEHNNTYKFAIAFENEDYPGYVTEKICDIYKSNCIPIYWGTKEVVNDFNPKTFINANDFANFDELIEYIIKVDNDDELFSSYFKEPMFSNKWLDAFNDPNKTFYKNLADCITGKNNNLVDNVFNNKKIKDNMLKLWRENNIDSIYNFPISKHWFCNSELKNYILNNVDLNNSYKILEIGSFEGCSSCFFSDILLNNKDSFMICIDPFISDGCNVVDNNDLKNKFYSNIKKTMNNKKIIVEEKYSDDFYKDYDGDNKFNFIYIDGEHSDKQIIIDLENCFNLLEINGIMWCDDYNNNWINTFKKWINENNSCIEIIHTGYQLGIVKKTNSININKKLNIFNIWHNKLFDKCYEKLDAYSLNKLTMYDVNQTYPKVYNTDKKYNIVREYDLQYYNSLYQETNYCQTSCLYHVFKNNLYTKTQYIGFIQYDMELSSDFIYDIEQKINKTDHDIYFYSMIVTNKIDVGYICNPYANSILEKYNNYFNTEHTYESIKAHKKSCNFICLHTFVIPTKTFIKMMTWYCTITDWLHSNYITGIYAESMSEVTEEIFGLFLLLQIIENDNIQLEELKLYHQWPSLHNETTFSNYKKPLHYFSLDKIVDNRLTDKNTCHIYLETYEKLMKDKCLSCKNILEIGIATGGSMKLWNDYFVNANIYGIDINEPHSFLKEFKRVIPLKMDAYSQESIDYFLKQNIEFDFIIDDGPHSFESMIYFIQNYTKLLANGGTLIVEDIPDINWCETFKTLVPNGYAYEIFDLRYIKNRWDDILFVIKKISPTAIDSENIKLEISENIESDVNNAYNLSIMSIFKNETMNLKIWLDHYLWQGVEHFYLIDNGSTDNPFDILQEYIDKGLVTYYYRAEKHQQVQHYIHIFDIENLKEKTKLLCICDLDEFFFGTEKILVNALDKFENYDVIYTNSYFYGSDNLIEHPKDIRTAILYREEDIVNGIKYFFKPSSINNSSEIWIHWLVEPGTIQKKRMNEITQNHTIRLNHYRIQSLEYFKNVKMTRGDVSMQSNENIRDMNYFEQYTKLSTIKDDILKRIIEKGYDNINTVNINTAVIVEPRLLKHLPFVINDFYTKLGKEWKIVFYCGVELKNIWKNLLNNEDIDIRELKYNCYKYHEYCDIIKSKKFWETLYGDYVLLFTADSTIINEPPYTIDYFMSLNKSYIGGNQCYLWNEMIRENIYPQYKNFQGGLSLRKRLDMIKIIDTFGTQQTVENCQQSQNLLTDAEDVYFTVGCYKLGIPVGDDENCSYFSVHNYIKDKFFGANRINQGYYINLSEKYNNICNNVYLFKNINDIDNEILINNSGGGFFSNCTVKLFDIVLYFNAVKKLPLFVDGSTQFDLYKYGTNINDITYEYFCNNLDYNINYEEPIDFKQNYQYINYSKLSFNKVTPFITKYFSPSTKILENISFIEKKYDIDCYNDICVLFYRGNDKVTECILPSYDEFIKKARTLYNKNNHIKFLIQSDECEFIERMTQEFPNNSFYFKDEIRTINKNDNLTVDKINHETNFVYSQYYLAITIMMSKCKYVVCTTGNCSLWIILFRGNADNIYQL